MYIFIVCHILFFSLAYNSILNDGSSTSPNFIFLYFTFYSSFLLHLCSQTFLYRVWLRLIWRIPMSYTIIIVRLHQLITQSTKDTRQSLCEKLWHQSTGPLGVYNNKHKRTTRATVQGHTSCTVILIIQFNFNKYPTNHLSHIPCVQRRIPWFKKFTFITKHTYSHD
jgi:hypothetical protein